MTALARCWSAYVRSPAVWVFWGLMAVYVGDTRARAEVDCIPAPYAAWAVVRTGSLDVSGYPDLLPYHESGLKRLPDGRVVPQRTPGSVFATVPVILPFALTREHPPTPGTMHALGKAAAAIHVAAAGAVFFLLCRRLAPSAAWPATVLFALGSCLFSVAAQASWVHGPATFYLTAALYLVVRSAVGGWWLPLVAGGCLGMAVLNRPPTALFAVATGLALIVRRDWRVIPVTLGGLGPVAYMLWLNWSHFGSPLVGGYGTEVQLDPPPLWVGLGGLLVAPSRGLFVYSPPLLLIPLGFLALRTPTDAQRPHRPLLLLWAAAAAGTVVVYARWNDWPGGWCYGPRFLCETYPVLCLLFAVGVDRVRATGFRIGVWGLVGAAVVIHIVGVFGGRGYAAWQERHDRTATSDDPHGRRMFDLSDTQIAAHARGLWDQLAGPRR
jgi:hypothetical protein